MAIDINAGVLRAEDGLEQRLKEAHPPYAEAAETERELSQRALREKETEELLIRPHGYEAVRFALLPHLRPVLLPEDGQRFSVALLALEYTNANPQTGNYAKDPGTGQRPPAEWRVGYVRLSQYEFWRLCQLREDNEEYEGLYALDLVMTALPAVPGMRKEQFVCIYIKSRKLLWPSEPEAAKKVEEAARQLASGLAERLGGKASVEDWAALEEQARPRWDENFDKPYSLALIDQAAEDFPGFGERCRKILDGAPARQTFLMDDAKAFMQLDYLAHGSNAIYDPYGNEPVAGFFIDTHWGYGIRAIEKFASEFNLRLSTACAVLAANISRIMRIDLKGEEAGASEYGPPVPEEMLAQQKAKRGF